jgi:hypothetical protein
MRWLLFALLVACERIEPTPPSTPTPSPPGPRPIELPAPDPVRVDQPAPLPDDYLVPTTHIRLLPNEVFVGRVRVFHTTKPAFELAEHSAVGAAIGKAMPTPEPESRVIISAHEDVMHGLVIAALEAAKTAGHTRIAFSIEPPP